MELSNRSQKKVDSILLHGSRLFVQHGYHKVTMESIAQYANVSKVTLYKYFSDKQALYEHILKENFLKEYNEVVEIINSRLSFEEKIVQYILAKIRKYYDKSQPIFKDEITLSLGIQKFIRKYNNLLLIERNKLFTQGKMEDFICEDVSDDTLELYFKVIKNGLISINKDIGDFENETLSELIKSLYSGILGCHN